MFKRPHMIAITMICRLYGEKNPQHFKLEWVPLLHQIVKKGKIFNWAEILSANILLVVKRSLESPPRFGVGFFMSSYLIDVVCAITPFPLMKWSWSLYEKPIHIYCSVLWNKKCKNHFYDICEFSWPLYMI
jgi:hypothetical protein